MLTHRCSLFALSFALQFSVACGEENSSYGGASPLEGTGGTQSAGTGSAPENDDPQADGETAGSAGDAEVPANEGTGGPAGDGGSAGDAEVKTPAGTAPTATEAAQAMGRGFNLGQMFESTQHPRTLEAASAKIDAYYERGFRNVRIPVTWTEEVGGDMLVHDPTVGDVNREHARLTVIEQVVDYALSKPELYVVINAHHEHALKTEARSAVLERLWQDISDIFGDRSYRLLFEVLNEPHKDDTTPMAPEDLRTMTGLAYDAIRAVNEKRVVLIGGNQWFGAHEVPAVWTNLEEVGGGQDPYVMATFHHYNPWTFCGDNQGSYDDAWTDADLADPMDTMSDWAETVGNGMPVYIGEWGVGWGSRYSTMTCNNIRHWYENFDQNFAAPKGQPTAVWDDGGWFEIFDHSTQSFDNNLIDCLADGTCEWDGEERFNEGCE